MIARIGFVTVVIVAVTGVNAVVSGHTTVPTPMLAGLVLWAVLVSVIAVVQWWRLRDLEGRR